MTILKRHHIYFLGLQFRLCLGHLETLSDSDYCNSIRTIVGRNILIQWRCGNCYQLLLFQMSATQFGAIHTINNHRRREAIIKKKIIFLPFMKVFHNFVGFPRRWVKQGRSLWSNDYVGTSSWAILALQVALSPNNQDRGGLNECIFNISGTLQIFHIKDNEILLLSSVVQTNYMTIFL